MPYTTSLATGCTNSLDIYRLRVGRWMPQRLPATTSFMLSPFAFLRSLADIVLDPPAYHGPTNSLALVVDLCTQTER